MPRNDKWDYWRRKEISHKVDMTFASCERTHKPIILPVVRMDLLTKTGASPQFIEHCLTQAMRCYPNVKTFENATDYEFWEESQNIKEEKYKLQKSKGLVQKDGQYMTYEDIVRDLNVLWNKVQELKNEKKQ